MELLHQTDRQTVNNVREDGDLQIQGGEEQRGWRKTVGGKEEGKKVGRQTSTSSSWKVSEWREKKRERKGDIYAEREIEKEKFRVELSGGD